MKHFVLYSIKFLILVLSLLPIQALSMAGGGGGGTTGPSFSDGLPGSTSGCGAGTLDNSKATVSKGCTGTFDSSLCFGEYADCAYVSKGALCERQSCTCWGSMENNIWSQFCAPATGTFVFEVTNVVCSGGGSSLQFLIAPTPSGGFDSVCDLSAVYCDKGSTGNQSHSVSLTSGQCYTLMFDGNAGAACTWNFNINCTYALGVVMLDYKAKLDNDGESIFSWEVTQENEVSHYIVERSTDGNNFTELERVLPINDPEKRLAYQVIDKNPVSGNNYYRLKQIDIDKTEYTYKRLAITKRALDVQIYPNPIKEDLNINFGKDLDAGTEIAVYDILGNLVYKDVLGKRTSSHKIDMNQCTKGIYFLSIKSDEVVLQQKFYKD
jgi:hypothetical protein